MAAFQDTAHLRDSLAWLAKAKEKLVADLLLLGFKTISSQTKFFLMPVAVATELAARLREKKILVRDCTSFGLPNLVRVAARKPEENAHLLSALRQLE